MPVAAQRQIDNRLGIGLDPLDDRVIDFVGQQPTDTADAVANVVGRLVAVAVEPEGYGDLAVLRTADRRGEVDALDTGDGLLEDLRHLGLDDVRAGPGIGRLDIDHRRIDVGVLANRQIEEADRSDQQDQDAHHRRQHRPADGYVRENHLAAPFAASSTMTGAPLRSF